MAITRKNAKRPLYEVDLSSIENNFNAIALVEEPAIQVNWFAFAEETSFEFKSISEDKQLLAGPLLIPNKKIFRRGEDGDFDLYFSESTIELALEKFMKNRFLLNINLEHTDKPVKAYVKEIWLTSKPDRSQEYGYNLPKGSLFTVLHIEDTEFWNSHVRTGKVKGFSVEGLMSIKKADSTAINEKNKMKKHKFAKSLTKDGAEVYTHSDSDNFDIGDEVYTLDADGAEIKLEDGELTLEDGKVLVIADGKIAEVREAEAEKEPEAEDFKAQFTTALSDMGTRLQALETMFADFKKLAEETNTKFSKEIEKVSSVKPGSKATFKKSIKLAEDKGSKASFLKLAEILKNNKK